MPAPSIFSSSAGPVEPRNLLSSIGEIVYSWDIQTDALSWGPNAVEVLGPLPETVMTQGLAFAGLVEPGSGLSRYDAIFSSDGRDEGDGVAYRTRYAANFAGRRMWVEDAGRWFAGHDGRPALTRGVLRLERAVRTEELEDRPPGMGSRSSLVERLDRDLADALAGERPLVVLVAAIDELARLNDNLGHDGSDELINIVFDRLRSVTRRRDHLVRYSGNRFAVILSGCPGDQAVPAAQRFIKAVSQTAIETSHGIALVRLRVGLALAPEIAKQGGPLLAAAEQALAIAKSSASDLPLLARKAQARHVATEPNGIDVQAVAALNERRVQIALQPVVRAKGRSVAFHEALLRVGQEQDGLFFSTAELMPMLESRGLVRLFDHRVVELATETLVADPSLTLSVNVSPRSLADSEWSDAFLACTGSAVDVAPRMIVEITETATIDDPARIARLLGQLKERGARIAIDDFGAGHTSLRHLRAFPIDILKIDGAFTQNLRRSTDDRFYIRTLIDLARHLGVETVAEWVDDELQAKMLGDWGVTYLQGHLVGKAELWPTGARPLRRAVG